MTPEPIPVLCPPQEITDGSLDTFEALLRPHLDGPGPGLIIDLGTVGFINSTGLGRLVKLGMRLDQQKRRIALARPDRQVERTLRLIGLDRVLPLFKTLDEAAEFVDAARAVVDDVGLKGA